MLRTLNDIMLRVSLDVGVARRASASDNSPLVPNDPAILFKIKDAVEMGRAEFYADFPDAQFRRRTISLVVGTGALEGQVGGDTGTYVLPANWMGPPQGRLVFTGGRGGYLVLTTMERVRTAHAQNPATIGLPQLAACELEATPSVGETSRWVLRLYPNPDQTYEIALRGRLRAVPLSAADVEPSGHGEAVRAYATYHLVSRGLITTGISPEAALLAKTDWINRIRSEEAKSSPRTLGTSRTLGVARSTNHFDDVRATNPWA